MIVFYLAQRVPYPPDRGDKIRTFNEIRHLCRRHEVHVFCLADGADDMENVRALDAYAASVTAVPRSNIASRVRALLALCTGKPFSVGYFDEAKLHRLIRAARERLNPDVALVFGSGMAQYVEPFDGLPRIMEFCDLDSLKWKQYAERGRAPSSFVYAAEARRLLDYERRVAYGFNHSVVCTLRELDDFERLIPGARASCIGNGVDLEFFAGGHVEKQPGRLVFTGVMDYLPNVDAVVWFSENVLPLVQETVPGATFTICGSRPTPQVQALATHPGVTVTGRVQDVRPYLDAAEVAVVPIRMARGIQNKLLEAMAMGLPCVSASAAWTGIEVTGEPGVMIADEPGEFADKVVALLRDPDLRARTGRSARSAVERHYSWDAQLEQLDAVLGDVVAEARWKRASY
jgi:sugar transferase (PEP-CTERM/EpsH1 system associated)